MGRTIKLILYYFAYQFAVAIPGMFGYTIWKCFETQSFDLHNAPTSLAIILSLLGTLLMAWHLIHYKYEKLDKHTLAYLLLKPTCLYILMGAAAIIWMNWLSEMVHLPNIAENVFAQMKNNVFGILSVCIIAPIFEEIFFRGAIEGYLLRKWENPRWAILVSALIFGLIHMNPAQILFAFLFGIILGELYYRTGSLLPSIILHFINNTLSLILMNVFEEKDTLTDILGNTTAVHVWGMTGIAIFCLTFLLFKKEVKPVQWAVEATEPVPAEETNPQN